jgi:hemerythrin-like domain-containing protein
MNDALARVRDKIPADRTAFTFAIHGYVRLLNNHIEKENNVLFVMAERQLPPEEHTRLAEGFERIE